MVRPALGGDAARRACSDRPRRRGRGNRKHVRAARLVCRAVRPPGSGDRTRRRGSLTQGRGVVRRLGVEMALGADSRADGPAEDRRLVLLRSQTYTQTMAVSRRTVTVLFADVADSTPLGERLDPESLRRVMSRWFEQMSAVLERHGGTVEKFIGDAVMAVFGIPELHEDDALRAVRAATELRKALAELNVELERGLD